MEIKASRVEFAESGAINSLTLDVSKIVAHTSKSTFH